MPDRIIRHGISTSEAVNKLSWAGEVFYRRLLNEVDDYGRFDGRPALLRAVLYPLKLDNVSEPDIVKWISECSEAGLVRGYVVSGGPYLEVLKFRQRRRAKQSKWPEPPAHDNNYLSGSENLANPPPYAGRCQQIAAKCGEPLTHVGLDVDVVDDVDVPPYFLSSFGSIPPQRRLPHIGGKPL